MLHAAALPLLAAPACVCASPVEAVGGATAPEFDEAEGWLAGLAGTAAEDLEALAAPDTDSAILKQAIAASCCCSATYTMPTLMAAP